MTRGKGSAREVVLVRTEKKRKMEPRGEKVQEEFIVDIDNVDTTSKH